MTFLHPPPALETSLLSRIGFDDGWALLERFSTLVRESGSADEHAAGEYIAAQLERLGVDHEVYEPDLYLSLPRESWVDVGGDRLRAKPPSFAAPTPPEGLEGRLVYVPSAKATGQSDLFASRPESDPGDLTGAIVLTDGYAMPASVARFEAAGAAGQIYINPGQNIHWGICTPIWGTPTTGDLSRKPRTPIVAINGPDGGRLREVAEEEGARVRIHAALEEGWYRCKLPVARIAGDSDDFMLVHGHYDSWDVGIGDNGVGDATLLELARIFGQATRLGRSLWIAWWPAHSTGRYGGSTWFADEFALDLRKRCVGAINIDSPGCWHATEYDDVMWMAEAGQLCVSAIEDSTEKTPERLRPLRAGDYSFNQIGLTSFYMLLSNIPATERAELGFYPTGGCGGNIAWHTEDDLMAVAERDNLERDLCVYVASIARVLEAHVLPFDFRATAEELSEALDAYETAAEGLVALAAPQDELGELRSALAYLYDWLDANEASAEEADRLNRLFLELSRILVPLGYAEGGPFDHDPALPRAPIPRLARINDVVAVRDGEPDVLPFLQNEIRRAVNHVANALFEATRAVERATASLGSVSAID
ncbi:MAG: M28 family peptidase [Gemmatimonadota bacterium]